MDEDDTRQNLARLIADNGDDYARISRLIGRNPAYIQQFIKRGSPKKLGETERATLAQYFGVDERQLGAPDKQKGRGSGLRLVPKLAIGASAGGGALYDQDSLAGKVGFDEKWLRRMGVDPAQLSLIQVQGESMIPTLHDGDDILVDSGASLSPLRDGIYVLRMDDVLMVKRISRGPSAQISVLSDNPAYPDWIDIEQSQVNIIGRVIWSARLL
jgi:hypothetical protein